MRNLLIISVILMTGICAHAAPPEEIIVEGVVYQLSNGAYSVTGWDNETPIQSLHILGEVEGLEVKSISASAFDPQEYEEPPVIESVEIDEGVTTIGNNAFIDCTAIEWIRMPSTLTKIGNGAFARCTSLQHAFLNEGLNTIGEDAFYYCTSLTIMVIPSTVTAIGAHAFSECIAVTDVYFLMNTQEQLSEFGWWDGIYRDDNNKGGTEFNGSRLEGHNPESGTHIHVPKGKLTAYEESKRFTAWLLEEDDNSYPLWWIVNYGVEGREYTVADPLTAVYVDKNGDLYAKDAGHWLTPDRIQPGEIDYVKGTNLMDRRDKVYDQSNWVLLRSSGLTGIGLPDNCPTLNGETVTGTLLDKRNPAIKVSGSIPLGETATQYVPNVYIPASVMSRTQVGANGRTYAFVRPKPQEYASYDWNIYYYDDNDQFYMPKPDTGINQFHLRGGFIVDYSLCTTQIPTMEENVCYPFEAAITRRKPATSDEASPSTRRKAESMWTPYVEGGLSSQFMVYPLKMPEDGIIVAVDHIEATAPTSTCYYDLTGHCSPTPHQGVNIVVTHDGKRHHTAKMIVR